MAKKCQMCGRATTSTYAIIINMGRSTMTGMVRRNCCGQHYGAISPAGWTDGDVPERYFLDRFSARHSFGRYGLSSLLYSTIFCPAVSFFQNAI